MGYRVPQIFPGAVLGLQIYKGVHKTEPIWIIQILPERSYVGKVTEMRETKILL